MCILFFVLRAFKPEFFEDTLNLILFILVFFMTGITELGNLGSRFMKGGEQDKAEKPE